MVVRVMAEGDRYTVPVLRNDSNRVATHSTNTYPTNKVLTLTRYNSTIIVLINNIIRVYNA
jgi:hypothetical protein